MIGLFVKAQVHQVPGSFYQKLRIAKTRSSQNRPYNKNCSKSQYYPHHSSGNMSGVTIEISWTRTSATDPAPGPKGSAGLGKELSGAAAIAVLLKFFGSTMKDHATLHNPCHAFHDSAEWFWIVLIFAFLTYLLESKKQEREVFLRT